MTANVSSSSVPSPPESLRVDLGAAGLLAPLPEALLAGRDRELLAPLRFLDPGTLPDRAAGGRPSAAARRELAAALAIANRSYGHPEADALAKKLADPATRVVVTGQQPGLLGGPLYTLSKAIAAARWAAALEAAGEPAVAVFWVATEDHDYAEVANTTILTAEGPRTFDLGPDPEPLLPVGMRALGPAVDGVLAAIAEAVPGERYAEWLRTVGRWYRPDARFGEAFCRLLAHLLGPRCPLLLDAMLPALKAAERPWMRRLIEERAAVERALEERDAAIEARGYGLQVAPQRGSSPLFLLQGKERRRIDWRSGDTFGLRGRDEPSGSISDLLQIVDDNPGVVSPGVLSRPLVQDAVLGTTLQILGPGEISYIGQVAALYPVLGVEAPFVTLRPQAMILETHQIGKLADTGLPLSAILGDPASLDRALALRNGGDFVAPVRQQVEEALDELRAPALASDPTLERPLEKTREQILRALDTFSEKTMAAAARRDEVQSRRVRYLRDTCLPKGKLQERVAAASHFAGKYGETFVDSVWEQMELDPRLLQVITL